MVKSFKKISKPPIEADHVRAMFKLHDRYDGFCSIWVGLATAESDYCNCELKMRGDFNG